MQPLRVGILVVCVFGVVAGCATAFVVAGEPGGNAHPTFSPLDFGAKGDGIADDTAACNAAAARAQAINGDLVFPPGVFAISKFIVISNGVRRVTGNGGVIRCVNTTQPAGVMLARGTSGPPSHVRRCRVEGLQIDCNHVKSAVTIGIFGQNISDCQLVGNRVFNLMAGYGILVRAFANSGADAADNLIENNEIEVDRDGLASHGIGVDAELEGLSALEEWKTRFVAKTAKQAPQRNRVIGNRVTGGYYGISLSAAQHCVVRGNRLAHQTRNMSVQNSCTNNVIEDNECSDSASSAIHLAYGSAHNRVAHNRIRTQRSVGEGLLQAYVGATENVFDGNSVEAIAPAAPKYHIYTGVHADNNQFINNRLSGTCARAYIAVESAFNPASDDLTHRNHKLNVATGHFANRGMGKILIKGNQIAGTSAVPALYLAQISDDKGRYPLNDCHIIENTVTFTSPIPCLKLIEDTPGLLSDLVLSRNRFPPDSGPEKFHIPRGASHFATLEGNIGLRISE